MVEPPCTEAGYISNYVGVDWLDVARIASIEEGHLGIERRGNLIMRYGA